MEFEIEKRIRLLVSTVDFWITKYWEKKRYFGWNCRLLSNDLNEINDLQNQEGKMDIDKPKQDESEIEQIINLIEHFKSENNIWMQFNSILKDKLVR